MVSSYTPKQISMRMIENNSHSEAASPKQPHLQRRTQKPKRSQHTIVQSYRCGLPQLLPLLKSPPCLSLSVYRYHLSPIVLDLRRAFCMMRCDLGDVELWVRG